MTPQSCDQAGFLEGRIVDLLSVDSTITDFLEDKIVDFPSLGRLVDFLCAILLIPHMRQSSRSGHHHSKGHEGLMYVCYSSNHFVSVTPISRLGQSHLGSSLEDFVRVLLSHGTINNCFYYSTL